MGSALASVAGRCMASPPWRRESRASPRRKRGGSSSSSGSTRSKRSSRPSSWRASDDHPWPGQADREGGRGRGDSASGAGHHGGSFRHDGDLLLVHHYPLQDGLDQAVMRPGSAAPHGHHPSPVPAYAARRKLASHRPLVSGCTRRHPQLTIHLWRHAHVCAQSKSWARTRSTTSRITSSCNSRPFRGTAQAPRRRRRAAARGAATRRATRRCRDR
mmetsp:Transcript_10280/g.30408  ORF Transcript_10280/g.30408 Transcript_10280/m.30408 type:complete len:216 (-) Transcript_10280:910-1557(-)